MENSFYILHYKKNTATGHIKAFNSLNQHAKKINLLITQAYTVKKQGVVTGYINKQVYEFAKKHSLRLMPLVTNADFDPDAAHAFLSDGFAQKRTIKTLLDLCKKYQFFGVQIDFEGVSVKDKLALTNFLQTIGRELHKNGFILSVAVIPTPDNENDSAFMQRRYQNWTGVYDLTAIGKIADVVTLMSYDQHTEGTSPGPTASYHWVEAGVKNTLRYIPANKISLGLPVYSDYWYTNRVSDRANSRITLRMDNLSYEEVNLLHDKQHFTLQWDANNKLHYAIYENHWLYKYLYVEDAKSFQAKLALAKKYHLRGVSVFRIGIEDPAIWKVIA